MPARYPLWIPCYLRGQLRFALLDAHVQRGRVLEDRDRLLESVRLRPTVWRGRRTVRRRRAGRRAGDTGGNQLLELGLELGAVDDCSSQVDQCDAIGNGYSTRLEGDAFDAPPSPDVSISASSLSTSAGVSLFGSFGSSTRSSPTVIVLARPAGGGGPGGGPEATAGCSACIHSTASSGDGACREYVFPRAAPSRSNSVLFSARRTCRTRVVSVRCY